MMNPQTWRSGTCKGWQLVRAHVTWPSASAFSLRLSKSLLQRLHLHLLVVQHLDRFHGRGGGFEGCEARYAGLHGGSANLAGLPAFIAGKVQAPVERGNVWGNICAFENYIPPIDFRTSMQYATAIGLSLRSI